MKSCVHPQPPWLTVIIPSRRGEAWIDQALRSLAAEPTDGIEVLVIDSSSNSLTRDIAHGYSDRGRSDIGVLALPVAGDGAPTMALPMDRGP